ncbi:MAG: CoA transferase [Pseudomonadota bacterium]|nr:CoA transferase [Pseudomonadota bacterium]
MSGALDGIRVLDLSRILAGPTCTQLMGDYGAEIIKIERPGEGDDTRKWGPHCINDANGDATTESAFYLSANRNKRSVAIDIATPAGQALIRRLLPKCDVLIENFRVGALSRYGLGHDDLRDDFPALVYCSITGFGQFGPYANRAGYDYLAQGMGGIMSVTGEPDGDPIKVGVGIADIMTGMHGAVAVLSALRHRDATGKGQHIDLALLDSQISWLAYHAVEYLNTGRNPDRLGNAHASVVPYGVFPTGDGHVILAAGNDAQFRQFCETVERPDLAEDPRFATNTLRIENREAIKPILDGIFATRATDDWITLLELAGVPCGPINTIDRVFNDPQVASRGMAIDMDHPLAGSGKVTLAANPAKLSETPLAYHRAPPTLGQHTDEVLAEMLDMTDGELKNLRMDGTIE